MKSQNFAENRIRETLEPATDFLPFKGALGLGWVAKIAGRLGIDRADWVLASKFKVTGKSSYSTAKTMSGAASEPGNVAGSVCDDNPIVVLRE